MLVCGAVPLLTNLACGVNTVLVRIVEPTTGLMISDGARSLAGTGLPTNSSAPMSGVALRVSPSISSSNPTAAPPDSIRVAVPAVTWRSELETNGTGTGAGVVVANDALSFVPAAERVLVYARKFVAGVVAVGSKSAA